MKVKFINSTEVSATKLRTVVAKDYLRPAMEGIFIDFNNSCMVATDAHIILVYPIDITENDSKERGRILPVSFFDEKKWMGDMPAKSKRLIEPEFILEDDFAFVYWLGEIIYKCRYIEADYPKYQNVIPEKENCQPVDKIGVDVKKMVRICEAFKVPSSITNAYRMMFYQENRGILFSSEERYGNENKSIIGMLMPVMLGQ